MLVRVLVLELMFVLVLERLERDSVREAKLRRLGERVHRPLSDDAEERRRSARVAFVESTQEVRAVGEVVHAMQQHSSAFVKGFVKVYMVEVGELLLLWLLLSGRCMGCFFMEEAVEV